MPTNGSTSRSPKEIYAFRAALHNHFTKRGIPEYRFWELEFKWVRQKGYRLPQV